LGKPDTIVGSTWWQTQTECAKHSAAADYTRSASTMQQDPRLESTLKFLFATTTLSLWGWSVDGLGLPGFESSD